MTAEELKNIGHLLRTQDNRGTADPIWVVQEKVRTYGMSSEYSDTYLWISADDSSEVGEDELAEIEGDPEGNPDLIKTYYMDSWQDVEWMLTDEAARKYIERNKHKHSGKLRTYVKSAYKNPQMKMIRQLLFGLTKEE